MNKFIESTAQWVVRRRRSQDAQLVRNQFYSRLVFAAYLYTGGACAGGLIVSADKWGIKSMQCVLGKFYNWSFRDYSDVRP